MLQDEDSEILARLGNALTPTAKEACKEDLVRYINALLLQDFERLVQLLYRVDVDEKKLRALLKAHPQQDAAVLIADLIIQRETEKQVSRHLHRNDDTIPEDEKW